MKPHVFLLLVLALSSCYNRFSCGPEQNKNLGSITYSQVFQDWNFEQHTDRLVFVNAEDTLVLIKQVQLDKTPKRVKIKNRCKSIDIKPYTAYTYYEYPNQEYSFQGGTTLLHIAPEIAFEKDTFEEYVYLNLSFDFTTIKAAIPIQTKNNVGPYFNSNTRFERKDTITLGNTNYTNTWECTYNNSSIYYNKNQGVVGLSIDGKLFKRL